MESKSFLLFLILGICCQAKIEEGNRSLSDEDQARVTKVSLRGEAGAYQFSVTLSSPDLGCEQYADWWEVVDTSGELLYRRILAHSHVNEQPFTRSGGPVEILISKNVWVRVHMSNTGYSEKAMFGSPQNGFESQDFPEGFASDLEQQAPLPDGCRF